MKLYDDLASWWPLLSPPEDYEEEAGFFGRILAEAGDAPARTLLELGSGGGNNASYLKRRFEVTLSELYPGMLDVSRKLNPECEHLQGDMRTQRLGRTFDRVFVHDAVCYMATRDDLRSALETAYVHCRPGGAALFAPDYIRENFVPCTDHDGADGDDGRSLRFLEWVWDPDPNDTSYAVEYAYLLRERDGSVRCEHERHVEGLFSREEWLALLREVGFEPRVVPFEHSEVEPGSHEHFLGVKPR